MTTDLETNIRDFEKVFEGSGDLVKRRFPAGTSKEINCYIAYLDMLVNRELLDNLVIKQLLVFLKEVPPGEDVFDILRDKVATADMTVAETIEEAAEAALNGDTLLFAEGCDRALAVSTKGWPNRGIGTTDSEVSVQGAKDAFTESFRMNTMLIRRRIKDTKLKIDQMALGRRTKTSIALMYLEDVARPSVVHEAKKRLEAIDIDGLLDVGYIEQLIGDDWVTPYPQSQTTERPDTASAAILEGRVVIVADNSPYVLIVPATMNTFFQAVDDYYEHWTIMSFTRFLRFVAAFLAVCLPGLYIAVACFHPSMIPMLLIFKMAGARQAVPFPGVVEILLMDLSLELLREAGLRLPGPIGNTIGIVGGLIIGQAAVEAGLVSPIVVIVVALAGISSFTVPHVSLVAGLRLTKYLVLFCSAVLGLLGFWLGILISLVHLSCLQSFGLPYLFPFVSGDVNGYSDMKDTLFRVPLFMMKKRPIFARPGHATRVGEENKDVLSK
ncbi:MAG: spore germination protein [Clostridiales bacterium]|jgi:spore germination protein|nr:spore germination protein [Clostridiales bacterium]MDR2750874.1 spore germination protein [Clostridiales bacterium]